MDETKPMKQNVNNGHVLIYTHDAIIYGIVSMEPMNLIVIRCHDQIVRLIIICVFHP